MKPNYSPINYPRLTVSLIARNLVNFVLGMVSFVIGFLTFATLDSGDMGVGYIYF